MKIECVMIEASRRVLLCVFMLSSIAEAQFNFTTNNGGITITEYTGTNDPVIIPDSTNGYPVTSVGNTAFYFATMTNVIFGTNIVDIGGYAFESCGNLSNVNFDKNLEHIGLGAFQNCGKLASLVIPNNVTNIDVSAFRDCTSLTGVSVPNHVVNLGVEAFYYDTSLVNVTIGSGVTNIGSSAFYGCNNLTGVYFEGNTPAIGTTVFNGNNTTVYFLPGTSGWSSPFGNRPAVLWNPMVQTGDGSFGVQAEGFGFDITGNSNLVVVVKACTDLARSTWVSVATNTLNQFVGTNGTSHFSDPKWTNYPARFYSFGFP